MKRVDILKKEKEKNIEEKNLENNKEKVFHKVKPSYNFFKKLIFIIKFFLFVIIILIIIFSIYISKWQSLAQDMIYNIPSSVLDSSGNIIAELGNNKKKKNLSLSEIPENVKNAYISIEDQRFYEHLGIDFPRTSAAIINYIKNNGTSSFGGSSITQQLVKNLTGDSSTTITRKFNEWIKAVGLELILDKNEILQSYLNVIYVGPNIYGVGLGANYYFDKDISELNLAESAFLAGITHSPNSYNPFSDKDNSEKIKTRTTVVLSKMLELDYISNNEYNTAIEMLSNGLAFKQGQIELINQDNIFSYHTDALINEIIEDISKNKNISTEFATNYIEMAGLKIYSTQDTNIQTLIETELSKPTYYIKSLKNSSTSAQAAMVIINHTNGQVLGCVGGIGKKEISRGLNRATQSVRQIGSAGKPIAVLAPALEEKIITASSIYNDELTTFDDGTEEGYSPSNYNYYRGHITVRKAIESSQNMPFIKIMEQLSPQLSINYMKRMGISSLTDVDNNLNLALGGLDQGISPLEMAAAYATLANSGIYIEPTFYINIENSSGKTIIRSKQKKEKVFSKEVAYIVQSLLKEPVEGKLGTAPYCKIDNIDVGAKTGTTNNDYDRWLCGFTPYYTATTWFGFDLNETINFNNKNPAGHIWASVMKNLHKDLPGRKFAVPSNIETVDICPITGLVASENCKDTYLEYFVDTNLPTEICSDHSNIKENLININSNYTNTTFEQ